MITPPDAELLSAAVAAVARDGWRGFRPIAAARAAGLAPDRFTAAFPNAVALGAALLDCADRAMLAQGAGAELLGEPARDRLFDLLLRRFDALAPYRAAVAAALDPRRACLQASLMLAPRALRSMALALDAAGLRADPLRAGMLLSIDLTAARTFSALANDDDGPLLAALDQALKRAPEHLFAT